MLQISSTVGWHTTNRVNGDLYLNVPLRPLEQRYGILHVLTCEVGILLKRFKLAWGELAQVKIGFCVCHGAGLEETKTAAQRSLIDKLRC